MALGPPSFQRQLELLLWLEDWFAHNCDGDWEHAAGIKIETLDNPDWLVSINLDGTIGHNWSMKPMEIHRTEHDWLVIKIENQRFNIACGPKNLSESLTVFRQFWESGFHPMINLDDVSEAT